MKHSEAVAAVERMLPPDVVIEGIRYVSPFTVSAEEFAGNPAGRKPGDYAYVDFTVVIPSK